LEEDHVSLFRRGRVEEKDEGKKRIEDEMQKGWFKLALFFVILI